MGTNGYTNGLGKRLTILEGRRLEAVRQVVPVDLLEHTREAAHIFQVDQAELVDWVTTMARTSEAFKAGGLTDEDRRSMLHLSWLGRFFPGVPYDVLAALVFELADALGDE